MNGVSSISKRSEIALMMALQRLIDGQLPLTISRLAQEAGLHVSTVNRASGVLERLRSEKLLRSGRAGVNADDREAAKSERLESRLAKAQAQVSELRARAERYAAHIQFLELSLRALEPERPE